MATSAPDLTLVVPDLLRDGTTSFPALERLLARADPIPSAPVIADFDTLLFQLFGVAIDDPLPIAAVTHALDSDDCSPGWWLRADPVYLHLQRNHLVLFDQGVLRLSHDDATRLAAEMQEDFHLEALYPTRWYLQLSEPARMQTSSLRVVQGQDIRMYLPRGEQGKVWRKRLNDCQIILHNSPVNAEREARGDPPVNSLWFWGEGYTPTVPTGIFCQVWSNHPVALGLARLSATQHAPVPRNADNWLANVEHTGRSHLVVLENLLSDHLESRNDALTFLEKEWFVPLWQAARSGKLSSLTLYPCPALPRRVTGSMLRRRWWPFSHR
ncbi:conserved hypothetical protein [Gammaproteobacteria bacterium]